ncbi:unnamed protein product [Microthlaspi erraticum]|uniref:TF-B3 domain-containing protein n=1 Tax=Microthlaspi erraticum TaxID=1685480 RepID=A0A6D2HIZ1_9BRAS|nr:unnamed protein product [Microthlaspi erraticum]
MASASMSFTEKKHFFQPLLPNFQSHLYIPVEFFSDHIEGKHEGKTAKLISDASERTWKVKMEGKRLTQGWREFVEAHAIRIGDFVVFRHEGDMKFHVTALGSSCCEIQYPMSCNRDEDEDESDEIEKKVEENLTAKSNQSSSDLNCFSPTVTASNLSINKVGVPRDFAKRNGLDKGSQEILLMNEQGKSWESEVKVTSRIFIVGSWRSFCTANKLKVGDSCTFTLLQNTRKPVFRLSSRTKAEQEKNYWSEEENMAGKTGENRFVELTPSPSSLALGKQVTFGKLYLGSLEHIAFLILNLLQHLPRSFTRLNGLIKPAKVILVDKDNVEWSMQLGIDNKTGSMYISNGNGWKRFCAANEVGAGESLTLELVRGGASPLLKFCSKMEHLPFEAIKIRGHKRARVQKRSRETRPKLEVGESSRRTRASNQGNLPRMQPCSVSDQVAKAKQSVVDALTCVRRFQTELETMDNKLEDSLREIDNLERRRQWEQNNNFK